MRQNYGVHYSGHAGTQTVRRFNAADTEYPMFEPISGLILPGVTNDGIGPLGNRASLACRVLDLDLGAL